MAVKLGAGVGCVVDGRGGREVLVEKKTGNRRCYWVVGLRGEMLGCLAA